jgi:ABC-2 type transport system ATP-binding protein
MDIATRLPQILARTGSIIENPTFYPFASGRDNLRMVARLTGTPESKINAMLDLMDLSAAAGKRYKTYSLGMKQRLAVGAALLNDPDLLILDEPANGLDPAGIVEMRELMRRLRSEGHTILISSHVLHEIEQVCDRIVILNRGRIVVQGHVDGLLGGREMLEVRIDDPSAATAVLDALPWVSGVTRDTECLLVEAPLDRAADLTKALADQGLYVSGLKPQERTLEQYFLDVTESESKGAAA